MDKQRAINTIEMTVRENTIFGVDLSDYLPRNARIIGTPAITANPSTGGPVLSEIAVGTSGREIQFRADATAGPATPRSYTFSIVFTCQFSGGATGALEAQVVLTVKS